MFTEFPAPAGINRSVAFTASRNPGVPRASGDKPQNWFISRVVRPSSPRQRG